jgi:hypothetical protein
MAANGIILDSDTRKLQAWLDGAAATTNPTVTVHYYDIPSQTKTDFSEYRSATQFTVLAGTTETDIAPAPNQGVVRVISYINVYNTDSAGVVVKVAIDDNTTNRIQVSIALATTESAVWTSDSGWQVIT